MKKHTILFLLLLTFSAQLFAKVTLPALVGDNMVLQQQSKIKIWGWSKPKASIKVTTSWSEKQSAIADKEGNWVITLNTPVASFVPQKITVSDGEPLTLNNILIGEVWLCSGQSNMEMTFKGLMSSGVLGGNQTIAEAGIYPDIRLFNVAQKSAIKPQKDCTGKWEVSTPSVVKSFSAIGYLYGLQLRRILNVPIGVISSSWGGTIIEAWMDAESQKDFTDIDLNLLNNEKLPVYAKPISLYNGMIAPLVNYSLRGFIWYQGESNIQRYLTYADKMVAMIKLWRKLWENDKLPFFYAEIAPFNYAANKIDQTKEQITAALLREQQKKVMGMIDNVGMVCTNDLVFPNERNEIHPSNKPDVAKRFSYWAIRNVYGGGEAVPVFGPQYKSMKIDGNRAILSFESGDGGSVASKDELTGFEMAGSDSIFYAAKATKENMFSRNLVVTCDKVEKPVAVRYCFRNFLLGNAANIYGQPLVPFRTDNW